MRIYDASSYVVVNDDICFPLMECIPSPGNMYSVYMSFSNVYCVELVIRHCVTTIGPMPPPPSIPSVGGGVMTRIM